MAKNYFKPDWKAVSLALEDPKTKNDVMMQLYEIRKKVFDKNSQAKAKKDEYSLLKNAVELSALKVDAKVYYVGQGSLYGKEGTKINDGVSCMTARFEGKVCVCKYDNLSAIKPERKKAADGKKMLS